jgi:hypothetical protein
MALKDDEQKLKMLFGWMIEWIIISQWSVSHAL